MIRDNELILKKIIGKKKYQQQTIITVCMFLYDLHITGYCAIYEPFSYGLMREIHLVINFIPWYIDVVNRCLIYCDLKDGI